MPQLLPSIRLRNAFKRLRRLLLAADDEQFCRMIWAAEMLQSGSPEIAAKFLDFPQEAATDDIASRYKVHPWAMETLLNELFVAPRITLHSTKSKRTLNCRNFDAIATVVNALNDLEDAEAGVWLNSNNVLIEMHRIGQRQFEWQRGFTSIPELYRSAYIFNSGEANSWFQTRHGIAISDFIQCGFAIFVHFSKHDWMPPEIDLSPIGISHHVRDATARMITTSLAQAKFEARRLRNKPGHVAYKPSVLRRWPCISFGGIQKRIRSPLRQLIVRRITSGLFYDVVASNDDGIRNTTAGRFEDYCVRLMQAQLPGLNISPEFEYRGGQNKSPDLLICKGGLLVAAVECKARKMAVAAKFSEDPLGEARSGYDEMVRGVFQVWRFFSHARRGYTTLEAEIDPEAVGVVLTLDSWMQMFGTMRRNTLDRATERAEGGDPEILPVDRKPIVFCTIDDLEATLRVASDESFLAAIRAASTEEYSGWQLSAVHRNLFSEAQAQKPYPFSDSINEVLPWWGSWR